MTEKRTRILLFIIAITAFALFYLDHIAQERFYYWLYWWYDIMMHFLGGFLVGSIVLWGIARFYTPQKWTTFGLFTLTALSAATIGLAWEYFEFFSGALILQRGDIVGDTKLDLVMDVSGALVAWLFVMPTVFKRFSFSKKVV